VVILLRAQMVTKNLLATAGSLFHQLKASDPEIGVALEFRDLLETRLIVNPYPFTKPFQLDPLECVRMEFSTSL
jgi:hypothetical protein